MKLSIMAAGVLLSSSLLPGIGSVDAAVLPKATTTSAPAVGEIHKVHGWHCAPAFGPYRGWHRHPRACGYRRSPGIYFQFGNRRWGNRWDGLGRRYW